ncbi:MAG: TonB-dependent receptor plug domain-containing protein [Verrucomicrobia bacterium]|nr:TonB-dependent receptor plug domain-containing protein [Verrucomicrobiota bacterium]
MNQTKLLLVLCASAGLSLSPGLRAQTAPKPKADADETVTLSPFTVSTDKDKGYRATNSISGSRLDTAIKDLPMPLEVITEQFLVDTGAKDLRQGLRYSAGIQLQSQNDYGTPGGAYQGPGGVNNPEGATANRSQTSVKIRGFVTESVLRDGYLRQNSTDSINIGRVEVVRGPAALLYGVGNFGGIVNYLPKLPEAKQQGSVGLSAGSYGLKRATLDVTGPISKTWDFNYRLTAAWEDADDYTMFRKSSNRFISPVLTFKPTKTTSVVVDYENGNAKDQGVGFLRVRSSVGPGPNNDQNEHAAFYTLPGTNPRTFRWSGPDTHLDTRADNLRLQLTQQLADNLHLLVGYNRSSVKFGKLDVIGNLQGWTDQFPNADTAFGFVPFIPADPINGDSSTGLGDPTKPNRATLAYRWVGDDTRNDRDQVRAELVYKFKLAEGNANRWLRMDNMIMAGHTELRFDNEVTTYQSAMDAKNSFSWVTNYYNPTNASPLRFGQKQANGTPEMPYLKNRGVDATTWNQANYAVFQGRLLDNRLTIVSGVRRDRNETTATNTTFLRNGPPDVVTSRRPAASETTYQNGASFQVTRELSVYALKSGGLQPNFTGNRDTDGKPLPATLAKSKELGLKLDLFNGKVTGTVSAFKIKRTNSPIFYWWAPTSNYSNRFNPNRDIVYQVNDFRPSSLGGPGNNGAGQASLAQWNAGLAAGTIYQVGNNWYANASKPTGAAFLDAVFDFTKANKFSWPGWLYNTDANTNNTWDTRASGPDGSEYVLGADTSKGWDTQLMFTPNENLQIVFGYAHVSRVVESAGKFSKSPYPQDKWAVWYFPNTDWGLTSTPLNKAYATAGDSSSWTGTNWGQGLPMDDTPEHQFTAWANYKFPNKGPLKGLTVGAGGSHESPRLYLSGLTHGGGQQITDKNGNPVMLRTRARLNVDLMVRYGFKLGEHDSSVQLNVNNLLNDQKVYGLIYSAPTTARLEFHYGF